MAPILFVDTNILQVYVWKVDVIKEADRSLWRSRWKNSSQTDENPVEEGNGYNTYQTSDRDGDISRRF